MSVRHTVEPGECLNSIAAKYGWLPASLWDDPGNAELKALRGTPHVLHPGDVVVIPELRPKVERRQTGARHAFRRKGIPLQLRIRLLNGDHPLGNCPYTAVVDGVRSQGTTDADGWAELAIAPDARRATIEFDGEEYELALGHLDPVDEVSGAKQRLANLGFYDGPIDDTLDEAAAGALARFQAGCGLEASGALDGPTKEKLRQLNGM